MVKNFIKKVSSGVMVLLMMMTLILTNIDLSYASSTDYLVPITSAYTLSTGNTGVYSNINGSYYGSIYGTDSCKITAFYASGWCKVTYPVTGGTKTGYTKTTGSC